MRLSGLAGGGKAWCNMQGISIPDLLHAGKKHSAAGAATASRLQLLFPGGSVCPDSQRASACGAGLICDASPATAPLNCVSVCPPCVYTGIDFPLHTAVLKAVFTITELHVSVS